LEDTNIILFTQYMRLFLTSNSLSNSVLVEEFYSLVGKAPSETTIAFIPTAVNIALSDKGWFVDQLMSIRQTRPKKLDIIDISAIPVNFFMKRLLEADVLFFSGGHSSHLLHWLYKTDLVNKLPNMLKTRVFAGISAGSMIASPSLYFSNPKKRDQYEKDFGTNYDDRTLGFVDFYMRPHFVRDGNSNLSFSFLKKQSKEVENTVYGVGDGSAIVVKDNSVRVIGEGDWEQFNGIN